MVNTVLLLSSAVSVTIAHHALIKGESRRLVIVGLVTTLILAVCFIACQAYEYYNAPFSLSDAVVGSTFYFATGGHGMHVIVGTIFILVGLIRLIKYSVTQTHHVGLELAIYY